MQYSQKKAFNNIVYILNCFFINLLPYWFAYFIQGTAIKRESGEKPGQSRCCKLQKSFRHQLIATVSGRNGKEVLKWSKSEDLPMPDNRRDFTLPGFSVGFKKGKYTK